LPRYHTGTNAPPARPLSAPTTLALRHASHLSSRLTIRLELTACGRRLMAAGIPVKIDFGGPCSIAGLSQTVKKTRAIACAVAYTSPT